MADEFNFNEALDALRNGQDLAGKDGILTPLTKQLTEATLQAELESHLETQVTANRENGYSKKTIKSPSGSFELDLDDGVKHNYPLFGKALKKVTGLS